jgi:hypothetical protein
VKLQKYGYLRASNLLSIDRITFWVCRMKSLRDRMPVMGRVENKASVKSRTYWLVDLKNYVPKVLYHRENLLIFRSLRENQKSSNLLISRHHWSVLNTFMHEIVYFTTIIIISWVIIIGNFRDLSLKCYS